MPIKITTRAFIEKARAVHGERYDYSQVVLPANQDSNITIICSEHGAFEQALRVHLRGSGCRKCFDKQTAARSQSTESFIKKARAVHGSKYDYSKVDYLGPSNKIIIICPLHGEFKQGPSNHLQTGGCKQCGIDLRAAFAIGGFHRSAWLSIQKDRKATLYIIYIEEAQESFYKVGITYRGVSGRFNRRMPYSFKTVALYRSYDAAKIYDLERLAHKKLDAFRHKPNVKFEGETECFSSILPLIHLLPPETFFLKNRLIK